MSDIPFEDLKTHVLSLSLLEKVELMQELASTLKQELEHPVKKPLRSAYGLWADLNVNISEEDIAEARSEMWGNFPREDI